MKIDNIVNAVLYKCGDKISRGREYMQWLDTKPKVFHTFREWMFTYYPDEEV